MDSPRGHRRGARTPALSEAPAEESPRRPRRRDDAVKAWRIRNARISLTEEGAAEILMDQLIPQGTPDFKGASDYVGVDWKAIARHLESH